MVVGFTLLACSMIQAENTMRMKSGTCLAFASTVHTVPYIANCTDRLRQALKTIRNKISTQLA